MTDQGHHCPFLNRTDARCSKHFSLDHLGHAFDYCFGYYEGCSVYLELLVERRVRRSRGLDFDERGDGRFDPHDRHEVFQVTVAGRIPYGATDPASISHASRV